MKHIALAMLVTLPLLAVAQDEEFLRGDADGNGVVNIEDAVYLHWEGSFPCRRAADANGSGTLSDSDVELLLRWRMGHDVVLPAPGTEECGADADSPLSCAIPPRPCSATEALLVSTPDYELSMGTGIGQAGQRAEVIFFLEALGDAGAEDAAGVEFSVCHDADGLDFVEVECATEFLPDDVEIAFAEFHDGEDGWQGAVIFEEGFQVFRGAGPAPLFLARYDILTTGTWDISFCDSTGDTEVVPRVVADDRDSFEPELIDGEVVEGNTDFQLELETTEVYLGGDATVDIVLDSAEAEATEGWCFAVCFDPDAGVELDSDNLSRGSALSGREFEFESITVEDGRISIDALLDDETIPAADGQVLYEVNFPNSELLDEYELWFCSDLVERYFEVVADGESIKIPAWGPPGFLTILDTVDENFLRGDADGNGVVDGIVDAITILAWGFTGGSEPDCLDAADVDDDDSLLPILDSLYLLSWAFLDGPAPPRPTVCRQEAERLDGIPCLDDSCD